MTPVHGAAPLVERLSAAIRDVPDFPRPGILFKDITPLLADGELFRAACDALAAPYDGEEITHVVAVESRGFILGAPIAHRFGAGFVPVRKSGKLPHVTHRETYALEYGSDELEIHADALRPGDRVVIVDDVLATGGTAAATCRLVDALGATVIGCSFLVELAFLSGGEAIAGRRRHSLLVY
jgi:adenine phosphoribosyltransferase